MKTLLFPLVAALSLAGCSLVDPSFDIDNPTDAPVALSIDGKDLSVPAHSSLPITLGTGEHRLHSERLGDVRFIVQEHAKGGLINPTLSEYVTAREIYVTSEDKAKNFGATQLEMELGGVTFQGPYDKHDTLFIDKNWDFGLKEAFPDEQTVVHVDETGGRISTKVFTAPDFIRYAETAAGDPGAYQREQPAGYVAPVLTLARAPAELPALDPAFEAHAGEVRALYARFLTATTASEQKAVRKDDFKAQMAFTKATMTLGSKLSPQANQTYNDFVTLRSQVMGQGVVVLP